MLNSLVQSFLPIIYARALNARALNARALNARALNARALDAHAIYAHALCQFSMSSLTIEYDCRYGRHRVTLLPTAHAVERDNSRPA